MPGSQGRQGGLRHQKCERRDPTTSEKAREWVFRTCVIILSALSCFRDNNKALLLAGSLIGTFVRTLTCSPIQSIQQPLEVRFFNIFGIFLQMSFCGKYMESYSFATFFFSLYLRCLFIFYIWLFHYFANCDYLVFNGHMSGFQSLVL